MTDATLLETLRLADSSLPVGSDSVSYGLEAFVTADRVEDAADLAALLKSYLRRQLGPGELVALRAAHAGARDGDVDAVCAADRRLSAVTLAAELRESSARTGSRLLDIQRQLHDDDLLDAFAARSAPGNYATVLGAATARADIDAERACLLCCHEFVTTLLGAAQRLLRLGHTEIQRVRNDIEPAIVHSVETSAGRSLDEMTPFTPLIELRSAGHERADRRLFVS
jgi:urease accessory protein